MARFLEKKRFFKSYLDDKSTFFDPKNNMQKNPLEWSLSLRTEQGWRWSKRGYIFIFLYANIISLQKRSILTITLTQKNVFWKVYTILSTPKRGNSSLNQKAELEFSPKKRKSP